MFSTHEQAHRHVSLGHRILSRGDACSHTNASRGGEYSDQAKQAAGSNANLRRHVGSGDGARGLTVDVAALQHVRDAVVRHVDGAVAQALDQVLRVPRQPASKAPLLGEP